MQSAAKRYLWQHFVVWNIVQSRDLFKCKVMSGSSLVNETEQLCCNKSASSNFIHRRWLLFLSKPQNSEFP